MVRAKFFGVMLILLLLCQATVAAASAQAACQADDRFSGPDGKGQPEQAGSCRRLAGVYRQ